MGAISTHRLLSDKEIEKYAKTYRREEELFRDEERNKSSELTAKQNEKARTELEKRQLKRKSDPGPEPDFEESVYPAFKTTASIWFSCLTLVFLFHCLIWVVKLVFNISWDTWGWTKSCFFWGLGILACVYVLWSIFYAIRYKAWKEEKTAYLEWKEEKERLEKKLQNLNSDILSISESIANIEANREAVLLKAFQTRLMLPMRSLADEDYKKIRKTFFDLCDVKDSIAKVSDPEKKLDKSLDFHNKRIDMLFKVSIPSEAMSEDVLKKFVSAIKATGSLRGEPSIAEVSETAIAELRKKNKRFSNTDLDHNIVRYQKALEADTSGIFTKHDSVALENQAMELEAIYDDTYAIYTKFSKVSDAANKALGIVRLLAYRNIYMGAELLNIIRDNSGGGKLTTIDDSVSKISGLNNTNFEIAHFSASESINDVISVGVDSALSAIDMGLKDKKMRNYAVENPKSAALAVAGVAAFQVIEAGIGAWKKRNAKIESILKKKRNSMTIWKKLSMPIPTILRPQLVQLKSQRLSEKPMKDLRQFIVRWQIRYSSRRLPKPLLRWNFSSSVWP